MKKKFLAMILALCLALTLLPATALADGEAWSTEADTTWYTEGETAYTISTAAELAGLAKLVNSGTNFEKATVMLDGDIDLEGRPWTPIGRPGKGARGRPLTAHSTARTIQ